MALGGLQSCPENQKFKCTLFFATWSLQGAKLQDDPLGQLSRCWLTLLHPRNPKSKCLNSVLLQLQHSRFSLEGLRQLPVQAQLHSPGVLQRKFGQCSPSHQKCPAPTASDPKLLCKKKQVLEQKVPQTSKNTHNCCLHGICHVAVWVKIGQELFFLCSCYRSAQR